MENDVIEMELNNEVIDNYETDDIVDTELDEYEAEGDASKSEEDDNMLGAILGLLGIGAAATMLVVIAKRKEIKKARYERLKRKMMREAAMYGEEVSITKSPEVDENGDIVGVECEEVDSEENNED